MANFNFEWQWEGSDNLEAFHNAKKTPDAYKDMLRSLAVEVKKNPGCYVERFDVSLSAGSVRRTVAINGEQKREVTLPIGKESETTLADGRKVEGKITVESDNKITLTEKGTDHESTAVFEVKGDELTVTQTCAGVTSVMRYKKKK